MKNISVLLAMVLGVTLFVGCGPKAQKQTGFLSDYSKLEEESEASLRYLDKAALKRYSGFIVDPVQVRIYSEKKADKKLTAEQIADLTGYMHKKMVEAVEGAGKKVAHWPGPGVARLRIALTNIQKTDAINLLPQATLIGVGVGGASVEAEIIDSMNGQQIGAIVQSRQGSHIPFATMGDWTAAKSVIDGWAQKLQERLSE